MTPRASKGELRSVVTLTFAHAAIGLSSLIRVPFIVGALGQQGYGLYFAVGSITPILLSIGGGLRITARTLVSEGRGLGGRNAADGNFKVASGLARLAALATFAVLGPLALVLPVRDWLGGSAVVSSAGMGLVLVATVAISALAVPGGAAWGFFESCGRQATLHLVIGAVAVIGLAVTVAVTSITDDFVPLALLNTATSAAPFYVVWAMMGRDRTARPPERLDLMSHWPAAGLAIARALPPHATRTVDPFVISAVQGPAGAAVYAIAQRLATLNTLVIQALSPLISAARAEDRGRGAEVGRRLVMRTAVLHATIAGVVGAGLVVVGPALADLLARDRFDVPRSTFVAFLVLGVAYSAAEALSASATGPEGLRLGLRIDVVSVTLNLGLSVALVHRFGIVGPVWASAVAVGLSAAAWSWAFRQNPILVREVHMPRSLDERSSDGV